MTEAQMHECLGHIEARLLAIETRLSGLERHMLTTTMAVDVLPACAMVWWCGHRATRQIAHDAAARHRKWQTAEAERQRQWALQRQLRDLEQQIREEAMSEEWRAWHRQWRARQADIAREARRRLGLPEEER